jgi:hypothetical protein
MLSLALMRTSGPPPNWPPNMMSPCPCGTPRAARSGEVGAKPPICRIAFRVERKVELPTGTPAKAAPRIVGVERSAVVLGADPHIRAQVANHIRTESPHVGEGIFQKHRGHRQDFSVFTNRARDRKRTCQVRRRIGLIRGRVAQIRIDDGVREHVDTGCTGLVGLRSLQPDHDLVGELAVMKILPRQVDEAAGGNAPCKDWSRRPRTGQPRRLSGRYRGAVLEARGRRHPRVVRAARALELAQGRERAQPSLALEAASGSNRIR